MVIRAKLGKNTHKQKGKSRSRLQWLSEQSWADIHTRTPMQQIAMVIRARVGNYIRANRKTTQHIAIAIRATLGKYSHKQKGKPRSILQWLSGQGWTNVHTSKKDRHAADCSGYHGKVVQIYTQANMEATTQIAVAIRAYCSGPQSRLQCLSIRTKRALRGYLGSFKLRCYEAGRSDLCALMSASWEHRQSSWERRDYDDVNLGRDSENNSGCDDEADRIPWLMSMPV